MIDPKLTIAEILKRHPGAAPVLARHGLDTCCGGSHPLEFACRAHNLPLQEVVAALEAAIGGGAAAPAPETGITEESCVRDVLAAHPSTLPVFVRYGLMGCGGAQGPIEPLGWFARVHDVDPARLLEELRAAARAPASPAGEPVTPREAAREDFFRRFLKAAVLFTLTGGTALGAWALGLMALRGELGGVGKGILQVHGHWQLFGWVGLFVIGVAYHILPRLTGVPLPSYRAASASFVLLVTGTILRAAQSLEPSTLRGVLLLGGALMELAGCALFAWLAARILLRRGSPLLPYQAYLATGTAGLVAAALLNLEHARHLAVRGVFEVPPHLNLPYLTVFLVGFVGLWILGVSLRTLPVFMGLAARPAAAGRLLVPLTASLTAMTVGEALYLSGGSAGARLLFGAGGAGLAVCLVLFTRALGILNAAAGEREPSVDRGYEKYLRLGYAWLLVSAVMLMAFSVLALAGRNMDHALVGAYRHALTVGFITTIMVGMASRIVPVFRGVPLWSARLREITFWLLATGNLIRVLFQSLSAFYGPAWLRIAGLSGLLELAALTLFGINLWKTLDTATADESARSARGVPIAPESTVGDLLAAYPGLLPVFVRGGFAPLANPVLRRTLARAVSLRQACRMHGVDLEAFLKTLTEAAARSEGGRTAA